MKKILTKYITVALGISAFVAFSNDANAQSGKRCLIAQDNVRASYDKNSEFEMFLADLRDEIATNKECACEIVSAAIEKAGISDERAISGIVSTAIAAAPERQSSIIECARMTASDDVDIKMAEGEDLFTYGEPVVTSTVATGSTPGGTGPTAQAADEAVVTETVTETVTVVRSNFGTAATASVVEAVTTGVASSATTSAAAEAVAAATTAGDVSVTN